MNCAIIVLFNPDLNHLLDFVGRLSQQIDKIILVDNTPLHLKEYTSQIFLNDKIIYIDLMNNLGIAKAHNEGIKKAIDIHAQYIVIFDQDSTIQNDFINSLLKVSVLLDSLSKKVAAIGPSYMDVKTNQIAPVIQFNGLKVDRIYPNPDFIFTQADYIISSGTLIKTSIFEEVGLMMDDLFIDYVDVEWGLRAKKMGYHCYVANNVLMHHSIGDSSLKVPFSKKYVNIHSDFRKYFIIRNAFYLILYSNLQWNWRIVQIPKTFMYFFFLLLFVPLRIKSLNIFLRAFKDAVTKKMGKGSM